MITNLRTFRIRFLAPTNTRPSRFAIDDLRHNGTRIESLGHEVHWIQEAIDFLTARKIDVQFQSWNESTKEAYLHTTDFATRITTKP